jgi:hypothetical protein
MPDSVEPGSMPITSFIFFPQSICGASKELLEAFEFGHDETDSPLGFVDSEFSFAQFLSSLSFWFYGFHKSILV